MDGRSRTEGLLYVCSVHTCAHPCGHVCAHVCTVSTSVITCLRVHILYRFTAHLCVHVCARLCVVWVSVDLCTRVPVHVCLHIGACGHVSVHTHICVTAPLGMLEAPGAGVSVRAPGPTPHPPEGPTWTGPPAAVILPAHPHRGDLPLNPRPIMLPYTPLLGLGGLPQGGQCASPGARAFGAPTPAGLSACRPQQTLSNCPPPREQAAFSLQRLALHHTHPGVPPPPSPPPAPCPNHGCKCVPLPLAWEPHETGTWSGVGALFRPERVRPQPQATGPYCAFRR